MPRDSAKEPTGLWAAYAAFAGVATGVAAFAAWRLSQAYSKVDANEKKIEKLKDEIVEAKHEEKKTQDAVEELHARVENSIEALRGMERDLVKGPSISFEQEERLLVHKAQLLALNDELRGEIVKYHARLQALNVELNTAESALAASIAECQSLHQQIQKLEAELASRPNPPPPDHGGVSDPPLPAAGVSDGSGVAATADSTLPAGSPAASRVGAQFAVPWAYRRYY